MSSPRFSRRQVFSLAGLLAASVPLAACSSTADEGQDDVAGVKTFRFTNAAHPSSLDVAQSGTVETARISAQILEPLVRANIDTGEPEECLAESWEISSDGLTYIFTLRQGVQFHNGSDLTPAAVVANVERWRKAASDDTSNAHVAYLQLLSGITSEDGKTPLLDSCSEEKGRVVMQLSRPSASFLRALTQPAFGIAAPDALDEAGRFTSAPVGTGAYTFAEQNDAGVTLEINANYWAEKPSVEKIIFISQPNETKRFFQMMTDQTDAYDLVGIDHYIDLAKAGNLIQPRDPYAISYLSINGANSIFQDIRVRQAVAYALNRGELVGKFFPQGSKVADDFLPSLFMMKDETAASFYSYNRTKAQELLEAAGYEDEPVEFYYPTNVSLAALLQPEAIYAALSADLVRAGFNIVPKPLDFSEGYLDEVSSPSGTRGLALNGFVGSYRDPNAFYSRVLATTSEVMASLSNAIAPADDEPSDTDTSEAPTAAPEDSEQTTVTYQQIISHIRRADQLTETDARRQAYKKINRMVAQLMPAVPLAYPVSSVVLGKSVTYYPLSATGISNFTSASVR